MKEFQAMATQVQSFDNRLAQRILEIDGLFELVTGAGLFLASATVSQWIHISSTLIAMTGILTMAVGGWLLYIARRQTTHQVLQRLAALNLAWTVGSGLVLALDWYGLAYEGRWLIALVADITLILGIAELYARRHTI
jgi:uncharacterized membrane protein